MHALDPYIRDPNGSGEAVEAAARAAIAAMQGAATIIPPPLTAEEFDKLYPDGIRFQAPPKPKGAL